MSVSTTENEDGKILKSKLKMEPPIFYSHVYDDGASHLSNYQDCASDRAWDIRA